MKKILLFVGVGVVALVIVASIVVGFFVGPIIKAGVETLGPKITQVSVTLKAVDVSLLTGSATIKGLVVGNPPGFKTPEAIKMGVASISMDPLSVFKEKILIRSIRIEGPEITYDAGLGGNNLNKILANVNAAAKKGEPAPSSKSPEGKETSTKPAPKIQVNEFFLSGAKVHVNLSGLSSNQTTVTLPDIRLKDLGTGSDGITAAELVRLVLSDVAKKTIEVVANAAVSSNKAVVGKEAESSVTKGIGEFFKK
jgi:uncharacterized protein involved in outer membrane biogenesis